MELTLPSQKEDVIIEGGGLIFNKSTITKKVEKGETLKKDDDNIQYARKCRKLKVAFVNRILSSLELNIIYISYSCVYNVFQCIDSIVFVRVFVYMHIYLRAY